MIEPMRIAFLGDAVADEHPPRSNERNELMGVDWNVVGSLGTEGGFGCAVFQEVAAIQ
jgi:hypothetical protein